MTTKNLLLWIEYANEKVSVCAELTDGKQWMGLCWQHDAERGRKEMNKRMKEIFYRRERDNDKR